MSRNVLFMLRKVPLVVYSNYATGFYLKKLFFLFDISRVQQLPKTKKHKTYVKKGFPELK